MQAASEANADARPGTKIIIAISAMAIVPTMRITLLSFVRLLRPAENELQSSTGLRIALP